MSLGKIMNNAAYIFFNKMYSFEWKTQETFSFVFKYNFLIVSRSEYFDSMAS